MITIMKKSLAFVPCVGLTCFFSGSIFLDRDYEKDKAGKSSSRWISQEGSDKSLASALPHFWILCCFHSVGGKIQHDQRWNLCTVRSGHYSSLLSFPPPPPPPPPPPSSRKIRPLWIGIYPEGTRMSPKKLVGDLKYPYKLSGFLSSYLFVWSLKSPNYFLFFLVLFSHAISFFLLSLSPGAERKPGFFDREKSSYPSACAEPPRQRFSNYMQKVGYIIAIPICSCQAFLL